MSKTVEMTMTIKLSLDEDTCLRSVLNSMRCIRWSLHRWGLVRGVTIDMPKLAEPNDGLVDYLTTVHPRRFA